MRIVVHTLVKNEENFIWFAINSVIDFVDEVMAWDQGSTDRTRSIIQLINNSKVKFRNVSGDVTKARQRMLNETKADWIFILDGDEIWRKASLEYLVCSIQNSVYDVVVVPNYMLIGDIYHYQDEKAGRYKIGNKVGHYNIRAIRKTPGLHVEGVYPNEAYVTGEGIKLQDLPEEKILFLDKPYLHASFLKRSSKSKSKFKYEIGNEFPKDFYYPEVFFRPRPPIVSNPWFPMTTSYKLNAFWQTPLKKIKRRII